jgi:protein-disulfide isomerase
VRIDGQKKYKITATPTIVINAKIYPRTLTFKEFQEAVDPLLELKTEKVSFKKDKKS